MMVGLDADVSDQTQKKNQEKKKKNSWLPVLHRAVKEVSGSSFYISDPLFFFLFSFLLLSLFILTSYLSLSLSLFLSYSHLGSSPPTTPILQGYAVINLRIMAQIAPDAPDTQCWSRISYLYLSVYLEIKSFHPLTKPNPIEITTLQSPGSDGNYIHTTLYRSSILRAPYLRTLYSVPYYTTMCHQTFTVYEWCQCEESAGNATCAGHSGQDCPGLSIEAVRMYCFCQWHASKSWKTEKKVRKLEKKSKKNRSSMSEKSLVPKRLFRFSRGSL